MRTPEPSVDRPHMAREYVPSLLPHVSNGTDRQKQRASSSVASAKVTRMICAEDSDNLTCALVRVWGCPS
jgi:hypothetical protein